MFADTAEVIITAGDGGAGYVSFHHEKYVDKGGPDGGDGGRGGDVVFVADSGRGSLADFRYKPNLAAKNGGTGRENNKHGRNGADLVVKVPAGTVVFRVNESGERQQVADLTDLGTKIIVARGGEGGFGNAHFKSSVRQTPRLAELGERGDHFLAKLELKMLANVGLVGFPNAGKSTFLSVVTNAKPEIANYAFTTLKPQLGVARVDDEEILIADIPGLIEGAADGKGLGDEFLRHVERCEVILHLIDGGSSTVDEDYRKIRAELQKYSPTMATKPEVVALTKLDLIDDEIADMQMANLRRVVPTDTPIFAISAVAHKNIMEVLRVLAKIVTQQKKNNGTLATHLADEADETIPTISLSSSQTDMKFTVQKMTDNEFRVTGSRIEKFAERTDFASAEGVNRLRYIMKKMGVLRELERLGANGSSHIRINDQTFRLYEWDDEFSVRHSPANQNKALARGHVKKHVAGRDD